MTVRMLHELLMLHNQLPPNDAGPSFKFCAWRPYTKVYLATGNDPVSLRCRLLRESGEGCRRWCGHRSQ